MSDLVGRQLGQYQLRELVRQGGMATVYKAHQPSLDRWVAVKVLDRPDDPQFVARFEAEARAIARFQHPNIVPVHDFGEQDGHLYLVVTYVEDGRSLADHTGRPMAPARALGLGVHLLAGLGYAHARGVVHRDVKPANVLLPTPDWPMLADFGIAKLLLEGGEGLTQQGMVVGTAAYMAPEQAFGLQVDARTDLYAVGVVLYELLTGRVPFEDETPMMVLMKQAYEPAEPARAVNPDIPVEVDRLLMKTLAKEPEDRFQDAEAMTEAIRAALGELPARPGPDQRQGDPLAVAYGAGVAAYSAGRWAEAIEHLRPVAAADPDYEDVEALLESAVATRGSERGDRPMPTPRPSPGAAVPPTAAAATRPVLPAGPTAGPTAPVLPGAGPAAAGPVLPAGHPGQAPGAAAAYAPPATPADPATGAPTSALVGPDDPTRVAAGPGQAPGPGTFTEGEGTRPRVPAGPGRPVPFWRRRGLLTASALAGMVAAAAIGLAVWNGDPPVPSSTTRGRATTTAPEPEQVWTAAARAPLGLESSGVTTFDGKVWIAGGFDSQRTGRASVLIYDPAGDSWSEGPELPQALTHAVLVSTGDELLLIGGYTGSSTAPIATVRRLARGSTTWADAPDAPDLPAPVAAGAAAWDGRRVVYAGGVQADGKPSGAVLALEDGSWRRIGTLPRAREHLGAASDGRGTTYFLAGEVNDGLRKTVYADVDAVKGDTVRRLGKVATPRGSVAGFWSPAEGACAAGGRDGTGGLYAQVECVNPDGTATRLPDLRTRRHGLGAVVVDGTAYALLGSDNNARAFRTTESLPLES